MNPLYSNLIIRRLWDLTETIPSRQLYAILDAARDERIFPALEQTELDHCCLLTGNITETLAAVAPYLVHLTPKSPFMDGLIRHGWGDAWGTFCVSTLDLKTLLIHFRGCLKVKTEEGKELFFRFYDPRVLRSYLPTCNDEELAALFGPVDSFVIEGEDPKTFLRCARELDDFKMEQLPFTQIV